MYKFIRKTDFRCYYNRSYMIMTQKVRNGDYSASSFPLNRTRSE
jgi:hypothetical protein